MYHSGIKIICKIGIRPLNAIIIYNFSENTRSFFPLSRKPFGRIIIIKRIFTQDYLSVLIKRNVIKRVP